MLGRSGFGLLGLGWRPVGQPWWRQRWHVAVIGRTATPGGILAAGWGKIGALPFACIPLT
eukprot:SAG11_NODE_114_length_16040_cov_10.050875_23_plen_60_part_00